MILTSGKQVAYSAVALTIVIVWFQMTSTDLWIQKLLFDNSSHTWLLDKTDPVMRFVFYDGIKKLLVLFCVGITVCLLIFRQSPVVKQYRKGFRIVLLCLILVPSVVASLKATTNIACPRDITDFGGDIPYTYVFDDYPEGMRPNEQQKCFPAGHASGGFALMSLYFLFNTATARRRALFISITLGWLMGGYKMIIGDHFLSHTLVTMLLAWLTINLVVIIDAYFTTSSYFWLSSNIQTEAASREPEMSR